ncbi:choice-of-anchor Q domain-containing protein [Rhodohalobacter sp. 614A]|uniref:choice-of-anchor Q domain-containing protein n=1 Tax=Rhodohalobacter sp. 614A TaxID=2908649 RepID=UPI001F3FA475|nr:choice-of-anchor Q domain-containing protein [Rhodohalobacter sp. 614A]
MKTIRISSIQFFVLFFVLLAPNVFAETFVVTRIDDPTPDGCQVGDCSLREAIIAANDDDSENHTIQLTGGLTYTLSISGDVISGPVIIEGQDIGLDEFSTNDEEGALKILNRDRTIRIESTGGGRATIDADGTGPVFMVLDETVAELDGLIITGGDNPLGGGFIVAYNENLTITNSAITGNTARSGGSMDVQGGVVVIEDSEISQNESISAPVTLAGAMSIDRAPLYQDATTLEELEDIEWAESNVTIQNSTVTNNEADVGGAFNITRSTLNVIESTVSGNRAYQRGGAFNISRGALVNIERSTISGNIARDESGSGGSGGAFFVTGPENSEEAAEVLIINSTISGNETGNGVNSGTAGGMYIDQFGAKNIDIINSTITNNTGWNVGGILVFGGIVNVANSIIANQGAGDDCQIFDQEGAPFAFTSLGYNLESETSCGFTETGDLQNLDPFLGPLQDNGGPVFTHALSTDPFSPAINNGSNTLYTNAGGNLGSDTDASGNDRVYDFGSGGIIDIGAFELQQAGTVVGCPVTHEDKILFVKKGESGTGANWSNALGELRDALALFEDETCTTGDVEKIWVTAGTYLPTDDSGDREATFLMPGVNIYGGFEGGETNEGQRDVESNTTVLSGEINGDNNLSGNSYHVVTSMDEESGYLFDFTITGGNANGTAPHDKGGGLYASNGGISTSNVLFENNYAETAGGAAYVIETVSRIGAAHPGFVRTIFRNNESGNDGGALALEDAESRITSVTFENNEANRYGGAIFMSQSAPVIRNVFFTSNHANSQGGAISTDSSSPELVNVEMTQNTARFNGGAIDHAYTGTLSLKNTTIYGNEAEETATEYSGNGGGIYNRNGAELYALNSIIWGNSAALAGNEIWNAGPSSTELDYSLYGNGEGDIVEGGGFTTENSLTTNPLFEDASGGDVSLSNTSPAINTGDPNTEMSDFHIFDVDEIDLAENPRVYDGDVDVIDMGAYEFQGNFEGDPGSCPAIDNILYVKKGASGTGASWANALGELRDAMALFDSEDCSTEDVDQIWVAEGVYVPGTSALGTFQLINGIEIYGGFDGTENNLDARDWQNNSTILSGDIDDDDNPFDPDEDTDSDTNTVSQTDHLIGVNSYHVVTGSGTDNTAILDGFTIISGDANAGVPHDTGGGIYNLNGSPTLINLNLKGNRAVTYGGGIYNESSSPTLKNVNIESNSTQYGGGIYNEEGSHPTLTNVTIIDNSAANSAGGMRNWDSNPTLTNVTISGNSSGGNGGGMSNSNSSPTLINSIIWGNTASAEGNEIWNFDSGSSVTLEYSLYRNGDNDIVEGPGSFDDGDHSLTSDPQFTNPGNGNYTLQNTSPAINGGDPEIDLSQFPGGPAAPLDLAGNPRVYNGDADIIDMGAYEFQGDPGGSELAIPTLSSPSDEATDVTLPVTLTWNSASGVESYQIQVVTESGSFDTPDFDDETTETDIEVTVLAESTDYKWRVRSLTSEDESGWSTVWTFTTTGEILPPTGSDQRIVVGNGGEYEFSGDDFGVDDSDFSIIIETLPDEGDLEYDGNAVEAEGEVSITDINSGMLTWDMPEGEYGYGFTSFDFSLVDGSDVESEESYTLTIDLAAQSVELTGGEGWRFVASPVGGETVGGLLDPLWTQGFPGSDSPGASFVNVQFLNAGDYQWEPAGNATDPLAVGQAAIVYVYSDDDNSGAEEGFPKTLSSSTEDWEPLDGSFGGALLYDDLQDGEEDEDESYFLLGNPHPIGIDYCQTTRNHVADNIDVWDPNLNDGDYRTLSCAGGDVEIAPFQGYWVRVTGDDNTYEIPAAAYMGGTAAGYFKEPVSGEEHFLLSLTVSGGKANFTNTTRILLSEQGTSGRDLSDGPKRSPAGLARRYLSFYSLDTEGRPYAVQSVPSRLEEALRIPLGIETTESGTFTLDWNLPEAHRFGGTYYLKDIQAGQVMELHPGSVYSFEIAEDQDAPAPRFELLIAPSGIDGLSELGAVPERFELAQNYPNPFNPTTVISYQLPVSSEVRLEVYDMLGRNVATLVNEQVAAGRHSVHFDASHLSSGIYLYRLAAGNQVMTKKLTVVK